MKHPNSHTDIDHFLRTVAAEATTGSPIFVASNRGNAGTAIRAIFAAALAIGALPVKAEDNVLRKAERSAYDARNAANSIDRIGRGIQQRDAAAILGSAGRILDLANRSKDRWTSDPQQPADHLNQNSGTLSSPGQRQPTVQQLGASAEPTYSSMEEFHRQFGH